MQALRLLIVAFVGFSCVPLMACTEEMGSTALSGSLEVNFTKLLKEGYLTVLSLISVVTLFHFVTIQLGSFCSSFLFSLQLFSVFNSSKSDIAVSHCWRKSENRSRLPPSLGEILAKSLAYS